MMMVMVRSQEESKINRNFRAIIANKRSLPNHEKHAFALCSWLASSRASISLLEHHIYEVVEKYTLQNLICFSLTANESVD